MAVSHLAFALKRKSIRDGILIPKYYDPDIEECVQLAKSSGYEIRTLRDLLEPGFDGSRLGVLIRR